MPHAQPDAAREEKNGYAYFTRLSPTETLSELGVSGQGLASHEAHTRRIRYGPNTLRIRTTGWWHVLIRQFQSPFIYLLVAAALLALVMRELIDGAMIFLFVFINASLGFFQEYRSEQALKILRRYTMLHAQTVRDGKLTILPVNELVPGDIVHLQPGDIVSADLRLMESENLTIDESTITGESEPVVKNEKTLDEKNVPIHRVSNVAFSGTHVVGGNGRGVVIATGINAYIGSVAELTVGTPHVSSFEKGMRKFSTFVLRLVGITLLLVFAANIMIKGPSVHIADLVIFSIALATAVIPEALPLVITFCLSRGAVNLTKHKVVVKRLSAIEDLGGIEVLCTDKTGTITENKLAVAETFGSKEDVLSRAYAAISPKSHHKDPFDLAIDDAFRLQEARHEPLLTVVSELPFDPDRKRNSVIVRQNGKEHILIVRGASEAIIPYLKTPPHDGYGTWLKKQGKQGRRVVVIAQNSVSFTGAYTKTAEESGLQFIGAIAFTDPVKHGVLQAVKKAEQLGVTIKIITGDSPDVAGTVAYQIGIARTPDEVITAQDFFSLTAAEQHHIAQELHVFARFSPRQKHQLIDILQEKYEVGFLGEGINDGPALKSADVALVVAGASDIAREAADVILLNKSLNVILDGIQEGREVFANTIKYVKMTLASNFGNFYAVAIATLLIDFLPMLPIQILLVNLLSDFPLIAIATDSVDPEEMKNPEGYNLREFALIATVLGLVSSVFDFIFFGLFYRTSPQALQTNWFIGSILTELVLLYSLRTRQPFYRARVPSLPILVLTILAAVATVAVPYTPFGMTVFRFLPPTAGQLSLIFGVVIVYFFSTEAAKLGYYRLVGTKTKT